MGSRLGISTEKIDALNDYAKSPLFSDAEKAARKKAIDEATIVATTVPMQTAFFAEQALRGAHAVMALRLQQERMASGLLPSLREYAMRYGLTVETLRLARADALVMHPGPMNEGVEIAPELADFERSVVTEQVANGVAIRMALLYLLAGTGPIEEGRVRG